jgi:CubicO group peptidase (beta-lactamase class C family)
MNKLFIICLIFSFSTSYAQIGKKLQKGIESAMANEMDMDSAKVTGFVIGLIDHDSTWIFPYGWTSKARQVPISAATRFELGALSHAFLLSRLRALVAAGKLDSQQKINVYLPQNWRFPLGEKFTVQQLMTHTSGLPKYPSDFGDFERDKEQPFLNFTEGVLLAFLQTLDSTKITMDKYLFSHVGMALLDKIMEPFGSPQSIDFQNDSLAQGYNLAQKPVSMWQFDETFRRVLGVKMAVVPLLNFIKTEMQTTNIDQLIAPTTLNKYTFMGNTWHIIKQNSYLNICVATGVTSGHSAFVAFIPKTKTGVVVLTNSRIIQSKLGYYVLRMLNNNWRRRE